MKSSQQAKTEYLLQRMEVVTSPTVNVNRNMVFGVLSGGHFLTPVEKPVGNSNASYVPDAQAVWAAVYNQRPTGPIIELFPAKSEQSSQPLSPAAQWEAAFNQRNKSEPVATANAQPEAKGEGLPPIKYPYPSF